MSPAARLQAALDLFDEILRVARPADAVAAAWFRGRRGLAVRDRAVVSAQVDALLRHRARLGWWLARHGLKESGRSVALAWLPLGARKTPDQVRTLFNGGQYAPEPLSAEERAMVAAFQGGTIEHPDMPEEIRFECPAWALEPLRRRFGSVFGREMAASLALPPLDLRVNTLKTSREAVLRALRELGHAAEPTPFAPHGLRVAQRPSLAELPMLARGEVEIQDEGSQLVAELVGAGPGDRVVDFCAGAGGKTLALATRMANKGHVVACDVSEGRLMRAAERFRTAGLHNIQTRLLASETDRWVKRHKAGYDRVLVDAPCTGTGTWRRNPDARLRSLGEGLDALLPLQARILASAARLVKPGGRLVYATCSLLPQENEAQAEAFLAAHPDFRRVPLAEAAPEIVGSAHPDYLSVTPARHGTDGFFAAVMTRREAPAAPAPAA